MLFRNWYYLSVNMTAAEKALEPSIAALGERYRSQWLFPRFQHIADFVLLDKKVVIEVDGRSHDDPEQRWKDIKHTLGLESLGYAVVRVRNEEAVLNPEGIIATLDARVKARPSLEALQAELAGLPTPVPKRRKKTPAKTPKRVPKPARG